MSNMRMVIALMIVVTGTTGSQDPYNVFRIPTKNEEHLFELSLMYQAYQNIARTIMADDTLIISMIRIGRYDAVRQIRADKRIHALRLQEVLRQKVYQDLVRWGYFV